MQSDPSFRYVGFYNNKYELEFNSVKWLYTPISFCRNDSLITLGRFLSNFKVVCSHCVCITFKNIFLKRYKVAGLSNACSPVRKVDMAITPLTKQHIAFWVKFLCNRKLLQHFIMGDLGLIRSERPRISYLSVSPQLSQLLLCSQSTPEFHCLVRKQEVRRPSLQLCCGRKNTIDCCPWAA